MTDGNWISSRPSQSVCVALCALFLVVNILVGLQLSGYFRFNFTLTHIADGWYYPRTNNVSSVSLPAVQTDNLTLGGRFLANSAPKPRMIVFPVFSLLTDPSYDMSHYRKEIPSKERLAERMSDFVESVQYSLKHEHVGKVILFYSQDAMPGYIKGHIGSHPKLSFERVNSTYIVTTIFEYIHEKFQNELVLITNGDVYPGEGFEHVKYDLMKSKRLFYAPTRHGKVEKRCDMGPQNCDKGHAYQSAHDTYIFIPSGPFVEKARRLMQDMRWDYFGMEHVILYSYFHFMQYKIFNPCHVIFVYHNHCSYLRHSFRPTFGRQSIYYDVTPSSTLQ